MTDPLNIVSPTAEPTTAINLEDASATNFQSTKTVYEPEVSKTCPLLCLSVYLSVYPTLLYSIDHITVELTSLHTLYFIYCVRALCIIHYMYTYR